MKKISKFFTIGILMLFLLSSINSVSGKLEKTEDTNIVLDFSFPKPQFKNIEIKGDIFKRVTIEGLSNTNDYKKPCLPVKSLKILLPYGRDVKDIKVFSSDKIIFGNNYNIEIGGKLVPLINAKQLTIKQKNTKTTPFYSKDIFPSSLYSNLGIYNNRGL